MGGQSGHGPALETEGPDREGKRKGMGVRGEGRGVVAPAPPVLNS